MREKQWGKLLDGVHSLRIESHDGKTHLFLDGKDISRKCTAYSLCQGAGGETAQLELQLTVMCREVSVSADGVRQREVISFD